MDIKEKIIGLLGSLIHPETGEDLVKSGFVEQVNEIGRASCRERV